MIEVITGAMQSGKSKLLIERLNWYESRGYKVYAFKPSCDTRWKKEYIVSRAGTEFKCTLLNEDKLKQFRELLIDILENQDKVVIAIDEIQFIGDRYIVDLIKEISSYAEAVIVSGLDYDSDQNPFGFTLEIADFADILSVVRGRCKHCFNSHAKAKHTIALFDKTNSIEVGDVGYLPVCDKCLSLLKVAR